MTRVWKQGDLEKYIRDEVEESLGLEYKSAGSLEKSNAKRTEITKDVSAMANSAGGILIYGIKEYSDRKKRHLPEKLDPIIRTDYDKEWLEHVISNIQPRIDNLIIHSINLKTGSNHIAYVVEIPQGQTAHQAQDFRYYKRYNFEAVPMHDYEIRDVMARSLHPNIEVELKFKERSREQLDLEVHYYNSGKVYAKYVNGFIDIPAEMVHEELREGNRIHKVADIDYLSVQFSNIHKDLVQIKEGTTGYPSINHGWVGGTPSIPFYITRHDPILPGLGRYFYVKLRINRHLIHRCSKFFISWSIYADNAPEKTRYIKISDIPFHD